MHLTVGIATSGRREVLSQVLLSMATQTRQPDLLLVCPAREEDVDRFVLDRLPFASLVVTAPRAGLTTQRNAILERAKSTDILLFLDDDFVMAPSYLAGCEIAFDNTPDLVMMTGTVIADGAQNAGIDFDTATRLIAQERSPSESVLTPVYNCYGCNMAVRAAVAARHGMRFDENLPLYGWLEDVDFSRRMAAYGAISKASACRGVHMASKNGRSPGRRLGYSQVANPIYISRKGALSPIRAAHQIARNLMANSAKLLFPEPWVDRKGRLRGNLAALFDLAAGKLDPQKITRF